MYACPNCGGNLKFDIPSQQLACPYCNTTKDPYSFEEATTAQDNEDYEVTVFTCPQCGGEIESTDTSAAEFCTFCGASTILHSRLKNTKRPQYIIPFKKTKEDCKAAYFSKVKKAIFAPDDLRNEKRIESFRGIYMPYWAFHLSQNESFSLKGTKSKRRGDYIITDHYNLNGELDAYYKGLSYDASSSFDDDISSKIAPYDVKGMKAFTPSFLSGFYADTADVPAEDYLDDAQQIACENSIQKIHSTPAFLGMSISSSIAPSDLNTKTEAIDRAMFPVWFMSYRNGDRVAYATVNGQTGKVVCDVPIDTRKYLLGSVLLALPIFVLLNLFFTILPMSLLLISAILAIVSVIIYAIEKSAIKKKETPPKGTLGVWGGLLPVIITVILFVLNPASDIFYYAGTIVSLLVVFLTIKDIICFYNILSTRRLPQFDRTGGDDRA